MYKRVRINQLKYFNKGQMIINDHNEREKREKHIENYNKINEICVSDVTCNLERHRFSKNKIVAVFFLRKVN